MQIDGKLTIDEGSTGREHRARAGRTDAANPVTPETRTERPVAGGATPVSRPQQDPLRDATAEDRQQRPPERRRRAQQELERLLRLPTDTRLDIDVDWRRDEIHFLIRERATGRIVRQVPHEETRSLLEKLREFSGALVDRSL